MSVDVIADVSTTKQCHANRLENRLRLKSELFQELEGQYYPVLKLEVKIQTFAIVEGAKVDLTPLSLKKMLLSVGKKMHVQALLDDPLASTAEDHVARGC
jgi:hypothetical protein